MGTGEWHDVEELYHYINVKVETDDLDLIIDFDFGDANPQFEPFKDLARTLRKEIEEGAKRGASELAERSRSLQELTIARNGNIASGQLISNIAIRQDGDYEYLIGANVSHFYPLCIEFGRGDVYPINFKYLHYFTLSGVEVFSKHSKPSRPYPYVEPSFQDLIRNAEEIIGRNLPNATN